MAFQLVLDNLVCRDHLFSFLEVNDLLRLRRVGKSTKKTAEDFIRTQKVETGRKLEIGFNKSKPFEEYRTFKKLINDLPRRTKLQVLFTSDREKSSLYRRPFQGFLDTYGVNITHLTFFISVDLQVPVSKYCQWYLSFFQSLPNIRHLVVEGLTFKPQDEVKAGGSRMNRADKGVLIPPSLAKLKTLRITHVMCHQGTSLGQEIFTFLRNLLLSCISNLERILLPFDQLVYFIGPDRTLNLACLCLFSASAPSLKLENMQGRVIKELLDPDDRTPAMGTLDAMVMVKTLNEKVISISRPTDSSFLNDFPNLEEIDFGSKFYNLMPIGFVRKEWPNIKKMSIFLVADVPVTELRDIFQFMFGGIPRKNLETLDMSFSGYLYPRNPFSGTLDILTSCSNLKSLLLGCDINKLFNLAQLWRGLPLLEKIRFERCHLLGDEDFIGEDEENPTFLKLTRLKSLDFDEIDTTMVTNNLFSQVLCHMPLKQLSLASGKNVVRSFTLNGILSLLEGKFATSIERLSLEYCQLKGLSCEDMNGVERLFRSYRLM